MSIDFRRWRDAAQAAREPLEFGPWKAGGWYPNRPDIMSSWRHWRPFSNLALTISETLVQTRVVERGPDYSAGPRSRSTETREQTMLFTASLTSDQVWRGALIYTPEGMGAWFHQSATAFGAGLYDAFGQLDIPGSRDTTDKRFTDFTDSGGISEPTHVVYDTSGTEDLTISMVYASDYEEIDGLNTPCRMIVQQFLHGQHGQPFDDQMFPPESDPDGVEWDAVLHPEVVEVYWTDTALAALASGGWSAGMAMTGGLLSGTFGPNLGGFDNGDFWQDSYSRSGGLSLTFS